MKAVTDAIAATLTADTTLSSLAPGGVHARRVPLKTLPAVAVAKNSGAEVYTLSARAWRRMVYLVKAVAQTKPAAEAADERIDALLTDGSLTLNGHSLRYLRRTGDVEFSETAPEGRVYWHVGGLYAIEVQPG